jgi:hypothetical protein
MHNETSSLSDKKCLNDKLVHVLAYVKRSSEEKPLHFISHYQSCYLLNEAPSFVDPILL